MRFYKTLRNEEVISIESCDYEKTNIDTNVIVEISQAEYLTLMEEFMGGE